MTQNASSTNSSPGDATSAANPAAPSDAFPVQIRIQRTLIFTGGLVCVALTSLVMWFCVHSGGVVLETFLSTAKDEAARKTTLNTYNSYSGSLTAVFVKPVELFLAMALTVGLLCFATDLSIGKHSGSRARLVLIVATAATGFLITNGFNAMNVQLASRPMNLLITAWDLSLRAVADDPAAMNGADVNGSSNSTAAFTAPYNRILLEETPRNPSSNSALRSAFVSVEPTPAHRCAYFHGYIDSTERITAVPSFGFPQRAWQSQVVTEAVEATKSVEFALGKANTSEELQVLSSHGVDASLKELPMKASTAINLVLRGILLAETKLRWWKSKKANSMYFTRLVNKTPRAVEKDRAANMGSVPFVTEVSLPDMFFNASSLPSSKDVLVSARKLLRDFFGQIANVSASEVRVELSSRSLPGGVLFEALTRSHS